MAGRGQGGRMGLFVETNQSLSNFSARTFPRLSPSTTSSADQDDLDLLNVPSLRVQIAAHIYDGLRRKLKASSCHTPTALRVPRVDNKCHAHTRRRKVKEEIRRRR
jgi:hypothetical protein